MSLINIPKADSEKAQKAIDTLLVKLSAKNKAVFTKELTEINNFINSISVTNKLMAASPSVKKPKPETEVEKKPDGQ